VAGTDFQTEDFTYRFGLDGIMSSQMSGPTGKSNLSPATAGDSRTSLVNDHLMSRFDSPAVEV
jgi:hypothetical protein